MFFGFGQHFLLGFLSRSSEVEHNRKTNILFFDALGGSFLFFFCVFGQHFLLGLLSRSSEVEHNPKMNILFFMT